MAQGVQGVLRATDPLLPTGEPPRGIARFVHRRLARRGVVAARLTPASSVDTAMGTGFTAIGPERLQNIRDCVEDALAHEVPGDLIEAGVWRGGATIWMAALLAAHEAADRRVWAADSYRGLPAPDPRHPADDGWRSHDLPSLSVPLSTVKNNFALFGLLSDRVVFLEGWFEHTLPRTAGREWAVIRLDGDMYGSTMDSLVHLYPGLSVGGWVIVDDYGTIESARQAVDDFRAAHGIRTPIRWVDSTCIFWQRES